MRIAVVMITIDREDSGRKNYFTSTMKSLRASGMFQSKTPFEFHVFDGGSTSLDYLTYVYQFRVHALAAHAKCPPNVNAGRALHFGGSTMADWVLFLEDDIEVCKNFLDGVAYWLTQFAKSHHRVFTFYTPYREVLECYKNGKYFWDYPADKFYGTQAFAMRTGDAVSLGEYLCTLSYPTSSYDIEIQNWTKKYPLHATKQEYFTASVPCFVQHMGVESVLFQDSNRFHQTDGYIGSEWSLLDDQGSIS